MGNFAYVAVSGEGKRLEGRIDAGDIRAAASGVRGMGLTPISVRESATGSSVRLPNINLGFSRVTRKDILFFTEELSTLVRAGLPLDRSLKITAELAPKPALRKTLEAVLTDIKGGKSLADALAAHPKTFTRLYVNMIRAGEAGGVLDVVLERLTEFERSSDELRSYLSSALVYPALLTAVGLGSIGILFYFVIPRFATIFDDVGAAIPPTTAALIMIAEFSTTYWWVVLIGLAGAVLGIRSWLSTPAGAASWDSIQLKIPLLGPTLLKIEIARFSRTLGTLLASSVPLIVAVRIVEGIARNQNLASSIAKIADGAKRGEGVSRPMQEAGVFPGLAIHLVAVGEETGRLDTMLLQVADVYDKEVKSAVKALTAVFEPVIILVMGIVIGGVVLSMLMAIFSINDISF